VLDMTVEQAHDFFGSVPSIARKLATMLEGRAWATSASARAPPRSPAAKAQRVKLSLELSKRDTGRTLFILDEPTTGLHFHDIDLLLKVLHRLRDHGNTVVVIEHNLDVIKTADWVVDLGPEGGDGGGRVTAEGTPEEVANAPESFTGRFLKPLVEAPRRRAASG
jgi:excinuclease ABC subunit A